MWHIERYLEKKRLQEARDKIISGQPNNCRATPEQQYLEKRGV